jgi:hypothetical protein
MNDFTNGLYTWILVLHSLFRWPVLLALIAAAFAGWQALITGRPSNDAVSVIRRLAVSTVDVQFLLGLLLYVWLSPWPRQFFLSGPGSLANHEVRFFALEHFMLMFALLVVVHLGNVLARRSPSPAGKNRQTALWFSAAVLLVLAGIPWWRPLLRWP